MPPTPKPPATRQRRNRTSTAATVEAGPALKPDLAAIEGVTWHAQAVATWNVWWASPMVAEWVDADVPDLIAIAVLVNEFWRAALPAERAKLHSEIRMASREFGLSPLSRRSLQWEVKRLEGAKPATTPSRPSRSRTRNGLSVLQGSVG